MAEYKWRGSNCRNCGVSFIWTVTRAGKFIPTSTERFSIGEVTAEGWPIFDRERHVIHFRVCSGKRALTPQPAPTPQLWQPKAAAPAPARDFSKMATERQRPMLRLVR